MREFGGWYHDLARRWDGTFTHQGPPEPDYDSYRGWDASGAYLLAYALPRKKLVLTGRKPGVVQPLAPAAAESVIADGRGWDNKDRHSAYDRLAEAELLARLGSWSPRARARGFGAGAAQAASGGGDQALLDSAHLDPRRRLPGAGRTARRGRARGAACARSSTTISGCG
jgi:hypothetical protein